MSCRMSGVDAVLVIEGDLSKEENYFSYQRDADIITSEYVHNIVVDLENIDKADSIVVSVILKLYKNVNVLKGSISCINANDDIKTMLKNLYITDMFN